MKFVALCSLFFYVNMAWSADGELIKSGTLWYKNFKSLYSDTVCSQESRTRLCYSQTLKQCRRSHRRALDWCVQKKSVKIPKRFKKPQEQIDLGEKLGVCSMRRFKIGLDKKKIVKTQNCEGVY